MAVRARSGTKGSIFEFEKGLDRFAKLIGQSVHEVTRETVLAIHRGVRDETPVLTGYLRANWQIQVGDPQAGPLPLGAAPSAQEVKIMGHALPGSFKWWVINNAPYAKAIEYGHSQKAPNGMVRVTLANVQARMDAIKTVAVKVAKEKVA